MRFSGLPNFFLEFAEFFCMDDLPVGKHEVKRIQAAIIW